MDDGDFSSRHEENHNRLSIAQVLTRPKEQPEFGDNGEKICIDCGAEIPRERAKLAFVTRCIYCQQEEECRGRTV